MSTTDVRTRPWLLQAAGLGAATAVFVPLAVLLKAHGPGSMWAGFLTGGGAVVVAFVVATWRITRHPGSTTTAERAFTRTGDERDDSVLTRAFAVLGATTLPLSGAAAIALAVGAETSMVVAILLWAQIAVLALAFAVINRRS